jgi:OOP family OmpA-OmpF porin
MKKSLYVAALALGSISMSAHAATADQIGKGYVFIGGNYAIDADLSGVSGASHSTESLGVSLMGGFRLNDNLALEGGYRDLGVSRLTDSSGDYFEVDIDGLALGVTGIMPIGVGTEIYAGAGLYAWDSDGIAVIGGTVISGKNDGNDLFFKFGVAFNTNASSMIHVEYATQELDGGGAELNIDNLTVGVSFSF